MRNTTKICKINLNYQKKILRIVAVFQAVIIFFRIKQRN